VITITHVVIYSRPVNTAPQVLVASRQIYADHYFDSSLALSAFVTFPAAGGTSDAYLLYTNRSRADALGGLFSGLKRSLVEREAIDSLGNILQEQKLKMEASSGAGSAAQPGTNVNRLSSHWWDQARFAGIHLFWWLLLIMAIVSLFWLIKRVNARRQRAS
jgi:hypothetical protein